MKPVSILPLFLLFSAFVSLSQAQTSNSTAQIKFKHLSIKDGLAGNVVINILQDRKGYMWFGTLSSLSRYDGYKFTNYTHRPHDTTSISQNVLLSFYEATEGAIWAGTSEGGIFKFDPNTEQFTTYCPPQPKGLYVPAIGGLGAVIAVQDNGTGIPDAIHSKIFQPFFTRFGGPNQTHGRRHRFGSDGRSR